ncbi:MAG: transposase, partial [Lachnospiraceae bacterium]|nr:transposase [Lachnospiraceae bacterium]
VQRDIYSAFLIQHTNKDLKSFNVEACKKDFAAFLALHQKEIERLQTLNKKVPSSMGIKKAA